MMSLSCAARTTPEALWQEIEDDFAVMQKQVNDMVGSIKEKFGKSAMDISAALDNPAAVTTIGKPEHQRARFERDVVKCGGVEGDACRVVLYMPGFDEDSIKVEVEKRQKKANLLIIKATKKFKREVKHGNGSVSRYSEGYSSESVDENNGKNVINYRDGQLVAKIELPESIKLMETVNGDLVIEGGHTMTLENDRLEIRFLKGAHDQGSVTKKLSMTDKK